MSKIKRGWPVECNSGAFTLYNPKSHRWRHTEINVGASVMLPGEHQCSQRKQYHTGNDKVYFFKIRHNKRVSSK